MTPFALSLNDPADPNVPALPPTDVRFRPDMRALELGEWNRATSVRRAPGGATRLLPVQMQRQAAGVFCTALG